MCERGTVLGQNDNREFALQQSSQYLVHNPRTMELNSFYLSQSEFFFLLAEFFQVG